MNSAKQLLAIEELSNNKIFMDDIQRLQYLRDLDEQRGYDYLSDDYLENIKITCGTPQKNNVLYFTPLNIVDDMLDLLPEETWSNPNIRILNICDKNGAFSFLAYLRFMVGLADVIPDIDKRRAHILLFQIYSIAMDDKLADNIAYVHNGFRNRDGSNVLYVGDYDEYLKFIRGNTDTIKNRLMEEFDTMEFDIVVGNPPYNRGMDLDFVNLGFELSSKYCLMITPAKWQTAEANQKISSRTMNYSLFREKIVPHMSKVVFYPCCKDIFDIYQTDGITYYLLDKEYKNATCDIRNICKDINYFNSVDSRAITNGESLLNIGNTIIDYLGKYKNWEFPIINNNKRYEYWMNTKVSGYDWYVTTSPRYVLSTGKILDKLKGETYNSEGKCIFESDNIDECKSFESWIHTKFNRFFLLANISKLNNIQTNHCFRFVPAPTVLDENGNRIPGKFDHIYTDEELYKTFNLPQEYIDVIEAVIKERKQ